ncbi:aspartic proteinase 36-like [Actinidia eriantha]|uniref:aspartic proteinase 36-like n=1 Tax=Actinidia eriantha TaxID=165200 RepID=UPI002587B0E9|nr:aspartic proteinase 36-like [Actinidia eriantha]
MSSYSSSVTFVLRLRILAKLLFLYYLRAHYNIILKSVKMGRDDLQLPSDIFDADTGTSMVIDSGTTLAYLADELYNPLITKVLAAQPDLKLHTVDQQFKCFQFTKNVDDGFPAITFGFENSLSLTVYPREYLFQIRDDVWCIGWQSSGISKDGKELNLLGVASFDKLRRSGLSLSSLKMPHFLLAAHGYFASDMVLSSKLFLYDLENQTIGWTEYNCSSSVKVKGVQTGAEYLIEAHDLSSACSLKTGLTLTLLLVLAFLHIHI